MSTLQTQTQVSNFASDRTCRNLCSVALGEYSAQRLYLRCAQLMDSANLHVIAHAFRFTAAQEKEHADVFCGLIAAHGGFPPTLPEEVPPPLPAEPENLLRAAIQSEQDESAILYPCHALVALEEGYPRIASAFQRIAETELHHMKRFHQYLAALEEGSLFRDEAKVSWVCLACGQLHAGQEPPHACSACERNRGHFIRSSHYPFLVEG